jgi:hypothetical protein
MSPKTPNEIFNTLIDDLIGLVSELSCTKSDELRNKIKCSTNEIDKHHFKVLLETHLNISSKLSVILKKAMYDAISSKKEKGNPQSGESQTDFPKLN